MRWTRIEFHGSFPDGAVLPVFKGSMQLKDIFCQINAQ